MNVFEVRMHLPTLPPASIASVARSRTGMTATTTDRTPAQFQYERRRRRPGTRSVPADGLALLTSEDLDLIHAVTGETLWPGGENDPEQVSDFALQIAADRRTGRLPRGRAVDSLYLLRMGYALTQMGAARNPFTGALLQRALDHLQCRGMGRVDVVM